VHDLGTCNTYGAAAGEAIARYNAYEFIEDVVFYFLGTIKVKNLCL
jgi:hypothetical protein